MKVQRSRLNEIALGQGSLTADTALRLAIYFGTTPEFWFNLQAQYDLDIAKRNLRNKIKREVAPRAACVHQGLRDR